MTTTKCCHFWTDIWLVEKYTDYSDLAMDTKIRACVKKTKMRVKDKFISVFENYYHLSIYVLEDGQITIRLYPSFDYMSIDCIVCGEGAHTKAQDFIGCLYEQFEVSYFNIGNLWRGNKRSGL